MALRGLKPFRACFFQWFSLGGGKTTRDISLYKIGVREAIWTAMKDANSNCKQILANLICIRCASSSIVAVICYARHNESLFFLSCWKTKLFVFMFGTLDWFCTIFSWYLFFPFLPKSAFLARVMDQICW